MFFTSIHLFVTIFYYLWNISCKWMQVTHGDVLVVIRAGYPWPKYTGGKRDKKKIVPQLQRAAKLTPQAASFSYLNLSDGKIKQNTI